MKTEANRLPVLVFDEEGCDPLTCTDLGDVYALSQVTPSGALQHLIVGPSQAASIITELSEFISRASARN